MNLISSIDRRHNCSTDEMDFRGFLKCYLYHVNLFGPNSCLLEEDGVEVDPIDHITQESFDIAVNHYEKTKAKREEWEQELERRELERQERVAKAGVQ